MLPSHAAPPAEVRLSRHGRFLNSQGCWSLVSRSVGVLGGEGCWGPPDPFLSHRGSLWALGLGRKHSSSAGPDPWPTGAHGAAAELETTSGGLQSNGGSGVPGTGCGHKQHCAYVGVCGGQASGPRSNCFKFQSRSDSQPCVPGQTVPGRWLPQRRARVPDARTQVGSQLKTRRGASGLSGPPPPGAARCSLALCPVNRDCSVLRATHGSAAWYGLGLLPLLRQAAVPRLPSFAFLHSPPFGPLKIFVSYFVCFF